jgi:CheY-like chemotaxis protein
VVRETLKLLRSVLPSTIEISTRLPEGLPQILADHTQINQVVVNLATNAAHAMEEQGGRLELKVEEVTVDQDMVTQKPQLKTGRFLRLWISDTGTGMTKEVQQRIFEPFFTTKEIGKGTGLGLAVVHGIVQQHDGVIVVYSALGKGTAFQLFFPVLATEKDATAAVAPTRRSNSPVKPSGNGQCIMLVDDEELVLSAAEIILRRGGYRVMPFNEPLLALKAFRESPDDFHLIVTDLTMPKIKGTKLAAEMRILRPGVPIILATGFGGGLDTNAMQSAGLFGPLQKPFTSDDLIGAVERALKASSRAS